MADGQHLLQNRTVHALLGLSEGVILALVGLVFLDGVLGWIFVAIAPANALMTMYVLGMVTTEQAAGSGASAEGSFGGE